MNFEIDIRVMPLKELLDPQGKAVMQGLETIGIKAVSDIRIGKNIVMKVEADNESNAEQIAKEACSKLLYNPVMEYFEYTISPIH